MKYDLKNIVQYAKITAVAGLVLLTVGCADVNMVAGQDKTVIPATAPAYPKRQEDNTNAKKIYDATSITVEEYVMSLGKKYAIKIDDKDVGTVSGNVFKPFGDVFTLKTIDGVVMAKEKEVKRFLRLNRAAVCYDPDGKESGFIGEEVFNDWGSISYVFHFYDANKNELGSSRKLGKSCFNIHKLYDDQGSFDYDIDKKAVFLSGDKYVLTIKNPKSKIPVEHAILLVCIEDVIGDSHDSED